MADSDAAVDPGSRPRACVVALAGRLVDKPGAQPARFPRANVGKVEERLKAFLNALDARALVCSAAAGADLLAIDLAARSGVVRHVILGAEPPTFVAASVAVRPGPWPALFRRRVTTPSAGLQISVLEEVADDDYLAVNTAILHKALALARDGRAHPIAAIVWEGSSRGPDDTTADFRDRARLLGFEIVEIPTLG